MLPKFSNLLCAFRECHSTKHALIRLVEQCRKSLDNRGTVRMVLMDLKLLIVYLMNFSLQNLGHTVLERII